ncbi:MAG: DUF2207 domain-containing protein, partial [Chloroflexi bacterium]
MQRALYWQTSGLTKSLLVILVFLFGLAVPTLAPVLAQEKVYEIANYDVDLVLRPDGSYRVTERITFDFQQRSFTFATRNIPLSKIDAITEIQVRSDDVTLQEVTQEVRNGQQWIRWTFPPRTGPTTFTLAYTVYGALFEVKDQNRVDWDAIGTGWSVPIYDVDVRVVLPASLGLESADITIAPAREGRLTETSEGFVATFHYDRLPPGTAYRVIITFPKRLEGRSLPRINDPFNPQLLFLAFLAGAFGVTPGILALLQSRRSRSPVTVFERPGISLPQAAVLLGRGPMAFPAVLFDLAARGHLTLRRVERKVWIFRPKTVEVDFHSASDPLTDFERAFLAELRRYEHLQLFGQKAGRFRSRMLKAVRKRLIAEGYLEDRQPLAYFFLFAGLIADLMAVVLLFVSFFRWEWAIVPAGLLFGLGASGIMVFARQQYAPTEKGARLRDEIEAYLDKVRRQIEEQREYAPVIAAETFIREMPWLILDRRVDRRWIAKLADALKNAGEPLTLPSWVEDRTDEKVETATQAYMAFQVYDHVT